MVVKEPINEREKEILALRGQPIPERPGYFFADEVYFEDGEYKIEVIRRDL